MMEMVSVEDALRMLRTTIHTLENSLQRPIDTPCFPKMAEAAAKLDAPRAVHAPLGIEEYVRQWRDYLAGKAETLELKAIRGLCWHPETATDKTFQYYLDHHQVPLSSRSLQGMVHSCHLRWSPAFAAGEIPRKVRARLDRYSGPSRLLAKWNAVTPMILGQSGAVLLGDEMLKQPQPINEFCERWGLFEDTPYSLAGAARAAELCRKDMDRVPGLRHFLTSELLSWQRWPPDRFKEEVGKTILHPAANTEEVQNELRQFVLANERLGDPRLPLNHANWTGILEAERKVIEWFSQFDIVFFFDHVLPDRNDRHGRKEFWLRYVSKVRRSRTLLSWSDRTRLNQHALSKAVQSIPFGKMADWESTSSFLLDFGKIVVAEFSAVGNACYAYTERDFNQIMPDFWTSREFKASELKEKGVSLTKRSSSFWNGVHRPGWQGDASQLLAFYGIRP